MYDIKDKKCIIFDLDGTLVSTQHANALAYIKAFSSVDVSFTSEEYEEYFGMGGPELVKKVAPHLTDEEVKELRELKSEYYKENFKLINLNLPLISFLKTIDKKTHSIALATMAGKLNAHNLLTHFKLIDYFDYIVTRDDVSKSKPDPECLKKVMVNFNVEPSECIVFEDSDTGIQAAKNAGIDYIKIEMD